LAGGHDPRARAQDRTIVIDGATVIDGTGRAPIREGRIVIAGDRISAIGARDAVQVPSGAEVIDARGRTVIPGLIDAHAHYREFLPELLITHGVTTQIDTGNYMDYVLAVREASAQGKLWGPRVFTTGSGITGAGKKAPKRDRFRVKTPEEARAAAEEHVRRGVDFIKVYDELTVEQLKPIAEVAHKAGIKVVGHIGAMDAREATLAGMDGLIHGLGISAALVSDAESRVMKETLSTTGRNPWGIPGGGAFHWDIDETKYADLIKLLVDRKVMIQPDLVHSAKGVMPKWDKFDLENHRLLDDPNLDYVLEDVQSNWLTTRFLKGATPEEMEKRRRGYKKFEEFLLRFHKAGGVLLAGSDTQGSATAGITLHQELEVFVDLGLTPMEALLTATKNVADFYVPGRGLGTLIPGNIADLVILTANPLDDIRNTRKIEMVMQGGRQMEMGYHRWYSSPFRHPFWDESRPAPFIASMTPYAATRGQQGLQIAIKGTGFRPGSIVWLERRGLKTEVVSDVELRAEVPAAWLESAGTREIRVTTPEPSGAVSNAVNLVIRYGNQQS
jgi:imidazolonepropionase-like amidohydrolase